MTVSHSTDKPRPRTLFPALKIMETKTPPLRYGRPPYWRAPVAPASAQVYLPTWDWTSPHDFPEDEAVTVLDVTAARMSALGSVKIAHGHLKRTGPMELPPPSDVAPGYYRVVVPYWAFSGTIVHPLGTGAPAQHERSLWIAAPTLLLLLELEKDGHLSAFKILDSYTADVTTTFLTWFARLRSIRTEYMDYVDMARSQTEADKAREQLDAFTTGYSSALSMMLTGEQCLTRRPDWAHTIYAQDAASTWRMAWRWTGCGRPLVSMGNQDEDEISVLSVDLPTVLALPKPPFRFDPTGRTAGALKPKRTTLIGCEPEQRADSIATIDETEDIL